MHTQKASLAISSITQGYLVFLVFMGIVTLFMPATELRGVPLGLATAPASFVVTVLMIPLASQGGSFLRSGGGLVIAAVLNVLFVEWIVRRSRRQKRNVA